ncbi:hypothetical protein F4692_000785 [Nocardioides cavernae]|uniref:NYN domain-containing protein n=1 Tax=Nocardioides cavernae TaxID=1921566 RepID=A0A7Y9KNG9_9ACTN|nr:NYN domain-containing protein [Nocardioides cavernae]NYE35681.1 hypothetical protein [Nocardioides cavernae]
MTNLVEPRGADVDDDATQRSGSEGELASLVRRWMQAGNRGRRDGVLRLAPTSEPRPAPEVEPAPALAMGPEPAVAVESATEPLAGLTDPAPRAPALPHRPTAEEAEHATRVAVLIDARRVPEDVAAALLGRLGERGTVNVCRAYADWTRSDLGAWVGRLRRAGLHSFHQFADDDDQALVAMAIDAVDIAREAAVDEVVIAGDLTSMLPLVHRLHAAGVRVVLVGPGHTPHDVRGACDEFVPAQSLVGGPAAPVGRHRA